MSDHKSSEINSKLSNRVPNSLCFPSYPSDIVMYPEDQIDRLKLFMPEVTFGKSGSSRYNLDSEDFFCKNDLTVKSHVYRPTSSLQFLYRNVFDKVEVGSKFFKKDVEYKRLNDITCIDGLLGKEKELISNQVLGPILKDKVKLERETNLYLNDPKFGEKLVLFEDENATKTNLLFAGGKVKQKLLWAVDSNLPSNKLDFVKELYQFKTSINQLKLFNHNRQLMLRFHSGIAIANLSTTSQQLAMEPVSQLRMDKPPLDMELDYLNQRSMAVVDLDLGVYLWDINSSTKAEQLNFSRPSSTSMPSYEPILSNIEFGYHPRSLLVGDHKFIYLLDARSPNRKVLTLTSNMEKSSIFGFKTNPDDRFKLFVTNSSSYAVHDLRLAHPIDSVGNSTLLEYKLPLHSTPKPYITYYSNPTRLGLHTLTSWGPNQNVTFLNLDYGAPTGLTQPRHPKMVGQPSQLPMPFYHLSKEKGLGKWELPTHTLLTDYSYCTNSKFDSKLGYFTHETLYHPQIDGLQLKWIDGLDRLEAYYLLEDGGLFKQKAEAGANGLSNEVDLPLDTDVLDDKDGDDWSVESYSYRYYQIPNLLFDHLLQYDYLHVFERSGGVPKKSKYMGGYHHFKSEAKKTSKLKLSDCDLIKMPIIQSFDPFQAKQVVVDYKELDKCINNILMDNVYNSTPVDKKGTDSRDDGTDRLENMLDELEISAKLPDPSTTTTTNDMVPKIQFLPLKGRSKASKDYQDLLDEITDYWIPVNSDDLTNEPKEMEDTKNANLVLESQLDLPPVLPSVLKYHSQPVLNTDRTPNVRSSRVSVAQTQPYLTTATTKTVPKRKKGF